MNGRSFICADCGHEFVISESILGRYKNWVPRQCLDCRGIPPRQRTARLELSTEETLQEYSNGPENGIFTDGHCEPNPGHGGWGAVKVVGGKMVQERYGEEEASTNNRMELRALIEGYKMIGTDEDIVVYSDSELCVNTITKWASGWKKKGWKKKDGEIKNLDLVKELYGRAQARPKARLEWLRGHSGARWNEYADALSRKAKEEKVAP